MANRLRRAALLGALTVATATSAPARANDEAPTEPPEGSDSSAQALADGAEATPPPTDGAPSEATMEAAKRLFFQGNELRQAGDCQRAIEKYVKSHKLVPKIANTKNIAVCQAQVGRYDEALEMYERLLTEFRDTLRDEERKAITAELAGLRNKVGAVDVRANVIGSLVIDGRPRGELPLLNPVRVLPGEHTVTVIAKGYRSAEAVVAVELGDTAAVVLKLEPITEGGGLKIDDASLQGAQIFVDGAPVGEAPWEGVLEPGEHYFFLRRGDEGSAPRRVIIVAGQTVVGAPKLGSLGPELRISTKPTSAALLVAGVMVGKGGWQGRLPQGDHPLEAREEGYVTATRTLAVTADLDGRVELSLEVDEDHPRWGVAASGRVWIDALAGAALAPTMGSGAEDSCSEGSCGSNPFAAGFLAGARAGYEFPIGLSIEIGAGYIWLQKTLDRTVPETYQPGADPVTTQYDLSQRLSFSGPFGGAGLGYRYTFSELFELAAHVLVGAHMSRVSTEAAGDLSSADGSVPVAVTDSGATATAVNLFVLPEARFGLRLSGFGIGVSAAVPIFTLTGPEHGVGDVRPASDTSGCTAATTAVACAPGESFLSEEPAYGTFATIAPSLYCSYLW